MEAVFAYLFGGIDLVHLTRGFDLMQFFGGIDVASVLTFFDSDEGDGSWLILLLLLSGPAFFIYNYLRYRNSDQRHYHEKETPVKMNNLRQYDNFVEHKTRQRDKTIKGANSEQVYGSLVKQGGADKAAKMLTSAMPKSVAKRVKR